VVQSRPRNTEGELVGTSGTDVAVVDIGVVTFKVGFHATCEGEVRTLGNPFRLRTNAEAAGLDVDLRIGGWTRIAANQERKRPILAAEGRPTATGSIGDRAGLVEAIDLHVGATA
jgi:hypothetical protein